MQRLITTIHFVIAILLVSVAGAQMTKTKAEADAAKAAAVADRNTALSAGGAASDALNAMDEAEDDAQDARDAAVTVGATEDDLEPAEADWTANHYMATQAHGDFSYGEISYNAGEADFYGYPNGTMSEPATSPLNAQKFYNSATGDPDIYYLYACQYWTYSELHYKDGSVSAYDSYVAAKIGADNCTEMYGHLETWYLLLAIWISEGRNGSPPPWVY